jgi:hypothetical protein
MEMMSFAKNNWKRFGKSPVDCIPAFLIGFIKLFASLSTECLNLYIVVSARSTVDVVKDFVALLSVLYISYIMTKSILKQGHDVEEFIAISKVKYPERQLFLTLMERLQTTGEIEQNW